MHLLGTDAVLRSRIVKSIKESMLLRGMIKKNYKSRNYTFTTTNHSIDFKFKSILEISLLLLVDNYN